MSERFFLSENAFINAQKEENGRFCSQSGTSNVSQKQPPGPDFRETFVGLNAFSQSSAALGTASFLLQIMRHCNQLLVNYK